MEDVKKACAGAVQYCTEQGVDITRLAVHYSVNHDEVRTRADYRHLVALYYSFYTCNETHFISKIIWLNLLTNFVP